MLLGLEPTPPDAGPDSVAVLTVMLSGVWGGHVLGEGTPCAGRGGVNQGAGDRHAAPCMQSRARAGGLEQAGSAGPSSDLPLRMQSPGELLQRRGRAHAHGSPGEGWPPALHLFGAHAGEDGSRRNWGSLWGGARRPGRQVRALCLCCVTVMVELGGEIWIEGGGLSTKYQATQLHLHWSSEKGKGSEHSLDGRFTPMEVRVLPGGSAGGWAGPECTYLGPHLSLSPAPQMHIVHQKKQGTSRSRRAPRDSQEDIAVLGFLVEVRFRGPGARDSGLLHGGRGHWETPPPTVSQ